MLTVKINQKGQITIPAAIRTQFGLHSGDEILLVAEEKRIIIQNNLNKKAENSNIYHDSDKEHIKKAVQILDEWMADESGYDEETWDELKKALNQERDNIGARRLFNDRLHSLAAQAIMIYYKEKDIVIATTNVGHLNHFVPAKLWNEI